MSDLDLVWGDLRVKLFRVRRRLDELGEKDEPKVDDQSTGETMDVALLKNEVARLEKKLQKIEKPQTQERRADIEQRFAGHGNVVFLVRRALVRCVTLAEATKFFTMMRKQADQFGDPAGRVFSMDDINAACQKVTCEFSRRSLDEESAGEEGGDKENVDVNVAILPNKKGRKAKARPQKVVEKAAQAEKKKPEARKRSGEEEDDEDKQEDLDDEQNIDLDVEVDETEMRGLVDLFETPLEPVDDAYRQAWVRPLPAGSWVADERALIGRLNKRGVVAGQELAGRHPGPGQHSFNSYATCRLQRVGLSIDMKCEPDPRCPPLQPHQQSVAFLLHPASPIERLLIDHPTGCGKTREMIAVLNSYFHDPRPKVPIFPTDSVCRNFYLELLRWPNSYRDFFCCEEPELARQVAGLDKETGDWKTVRAHMWSMAGVTEADLRSISTRFRECLEMSGTFVCGKLRKGRRHAFRTKNPGEEFPAAPLRALGYTSAGGSNIKLDPATGLPMSSLFKVGFREPFTNVYNRKIVLMDEVHNLVRSNTRYGQQLDTLRKKLSTAEDLVLVGFTATPIPNETSEGRLLLDTIKGYAHLGLSDEGFISSFPFKPPHLFPKSFPAGVPDTALTLEVQRELCTQVELTGDALLAYDLHARDPDIRGKQLRVYCNMFCFGSTFHDGKMGCKVELMARPEALAPKLYNLVREITRPSDGSERTKALVLISRRSGYSAMIALLRQAGAAASPPFNVATMDQLSEFNSPENARGEKYIVLVADSAECGEGISFKAVRRQYMADVPETPADFIQQCGRANRMYGHQVLDPAERTLHTQIYVAVLPPWMQDDALAVWCYRVFGRRGSSSADAERTAKHLRARFEEVRVTKLDELKVLLDAFATRKFKEIENASANSKRAAKPKEKKLATKDIADFYDKLGLAEEAELLRPLPGGLEENDAAETSEEEGEGGVALDKHRARKDEKDGAGWKEELDGDEPMDGQSRSNGESCAAQQGQSSTFAATFESELFEAIVGQPSEVCASIRPPKERTCATDASDHSVASGEGCAADASPEAAVTQSTDDMTDETSVGQPLNPEDAGDVVAKVAEPTASMAVEGEPHPVDELCRVASEANELPKDQLETLAVESECTTSTDACVKVGPAEVDGMAEEGAVPVDAEASADSAAALAFESELGEAMTSQRFADAMDDHVSSGETGGRAATDAQDLERAAARKSMRLLIRATQKLHAMTRAAVLKLAEDAGQSEDQRALANLQRLYEEFLPALAGIRNSAVDRMVLSRPEDRATLEAAALIKPSETVRRKYGEVILPPIQKDILARIEEMGSSNQDDEAPAVSSDATGKNTSRALRRGNSKMSDSAVDGAAPEGGRRGRRPKGESAASDLAAVPDEAPAASSDLAGNNYTRPLRRANSKMSNMPAAADADATVSEAASVAASKRGRTPKSEGIAIRKRAVSAADVLATDTASVDGVAPAARGKAPRKRACAPDVLATEILASDDVHALASPSMTLAALLGGADGSQSETAGPKGRGRAKKQKSDTPDVGVGEEAAVKAPRPKREASKIESADTAKTRAVAGASAESAENAERGGKATAAAGRKREASKPQLDDLATPARKRTKNKASELSSAQMSADEELARRLQAEEDEAEALAAAA